MNISGIRTYAGFYDYNTIKQSEMRSRQIKEAREATEVTVTEQVNVVKEEVHQTEAVSPVKDNGVQEFTKQYQPDAVYEMKGADSDIFKLDIEKAISDMKKDEVLMEYQFFVNSGMGLETAVKHVSEQFVLQIGWGRQFICRPLF